MIENTMEVSAAFLIVGYITVEMYRRIEISHPIFFTLFFNLIVTEFSILVDFVAMISLPPSQALMFVAFNNLLCLEFDTVCWFTLSVLRYE